MSVPAMPTSVFLNEEELEELAKASPSCVVCGGPIDFYGGTLVSVRRYGAFEACHWACVYRGGAG